MDYSQIVTRAFRLVWQHKAVWVVGLLGVLGAGVIQAVIRIALHYRPTNGLSNGLSVVDERTLIIYLVGVTVLVCFVYLLSVPVSGGLIYASVELSAERTVTAGSMIRRGMTYAGRLIAIDTLVFLPMSGLLIALMLLTFGLFVGFVLGLDRGLVEAQTGLTMAGGGFLVCIVPLTCLLLPFSVATSLVRTLAFRVLIVDGGGVRESIWVAWGLVKTRPGPLLISMLLLWGVRRVVGTVRSTLLSPLELVTLAPFLSLLLGDELTSPSPLTIPFILIISLITTGIAAIILPYTTFAWTLVYQQLQVNGMVHFQQN